MNKISVLFLWSVILIANIIFAYLRFIKGDNLFYQEHELLENLQASLLVISCIFFLIHAYLLGGLSSLLLLSLSLLSLTCFLREVNLGDFDLPELLILIGGSDQGRDIVLSTLWALMVLFIVPNFSKMKTLVFRFLGSTSGKLMLISAGFLIASDVFERWFDEAAYSEFFEELLEFNAYYFLFWGSLISRYSLLGIKKRFHPPL